MEEGIVTGGGCALLYAAQELEKVKAKGEDQKAGVELVRRALEAPIRQITKNAGVDGSVVVGKLLEQKKKTNGYDAQNEEYCDMFARSEEHTSELQSHHDLVCRLLLEKNQLKNQEKYHGVKSLFLLIEQTLLNISQYSSF